MTVDHRGGRNRLARNTEKHRRNITGSRSDCMHAKQKCERLRGLHFEYERDHQGKSRRTTDAGQQADAKAKAHADQHQAKSFPLKDEEEAVDECVKHRLATFTVPTQVGCAIDE